MYTSAAHLHTGVQIADTRRSMQAHSFLRAYTRPQELGNLPNYTSSTQYPCLKHARAYVRLTSEELLRFLISDTSMELLLDRCQKLLNSLRVYAKIVEEMRAIGNLS